MNSGFRLSLVNRFCSKRSLEFDNGEVIGCTPTHPFYSEKRQAYIPVGDIEIGEPIKNKEGKTIAIKSKKKKEGGETVYNLEVYRDHNFMVGYSGLLVHNSCIDKIKRAFDISDEATFVRASGKTKVHIVSGGDIIEAKELALSEKVGKLMKEDIYHPSQRDFPAIDAMSKETGTPLSYKEIASEVNGVPQTPDSQKITDYVGKAYQSILKNNANAEAGISWRGMTVQKYQNVDLHIVYPFDDVTEFSLKAKWESWGKKVQNFKNDATIKEVYVHLNDGSVVKMDMSKVK